MSTISTILSTLRSAVWAIDVRDEIANAIEQCYKDVNSPSLVTDGIEEVIGDMVDNGRISGAIVEDLGLITEGTSNLFDFTTVTAGRLNTSTGEVGEASGYWTSDFIPVENGKTYYFANTDRRVAYSSSKAYSANISGTTWTASADGYIRVSVTSANRKTAKINEGSAKDYRPGRSPIDFNLRDDVYRKAEVDAALAAVTIATDPELETAGAAADAKATGDAISELNESLEPFHPDSVKYDDLTNSGYIATNSKVMSFEVNQSASYKSDIFDCSEGDEFYIYSSKAASHSNSALLWAFAKTDGTVLLRYAVASYMNPLIAPTGATKLVVNVMASESETFLMSKKTLEEKVTDAELYRVDLGKAVYGVGRLGSSTWVTDASADACHCAIPVRSGVKVTVKANAGQAAKVAFLYEYSNVAIGNQINMAGGVYTIPAGQTQTFIAPMGSKYLAIDMVTSYNAAEPRPEAVWIDPYYEELKDIKSLTFGTPITILSNADAETTSDEGYQLSYFNIIQHSENLYYMYYAAYPTRDSGGKLLFAYSTDGTTYIRGFPEGIQAPVEGTNVITTAYTHHQVFKCADPIYPYRLIGISGATNAYLLKSSDGIHFDTNTRRILYEPYNDTQHCATCRGNIIKVYSRDKHTRSVGGTNRMSREITVTYYDLEGNMLSPVKTLPIEFVYNSAAIAIDETSDLIIPTSFGRNGNQEISLSAYTVDKYDVRPVESNLSSILGETDKFVIFSPSIITIAGSQYLSYYTHDWEHDTVGTIGTNFSYYKLIPITMVR